MEETTFPELAPPPEPADQTDPRRAAAFATEIRTHLRVKRDLDTAAAKLEAITALCEVASKRGWSSVDIGALFEILDP